MEIQLGFIPDDWHTAAYEHTVSTVNITFRTKRKMWLCTCGMSSLISEQHLYDLHYNAEMEYIVWMSTTQYKNLMKSGKS